MKRFSIFSVAVLLLIAVGAADLATAGEGSLLGYRAKRKAQMLPWNAGYYSASWGMPLALVVPPTAERQVNWGWGVGNTRVTPIYHQYRRDYAGPGQYQRGMFRPTPAWPSDTLQFGTYYARGPW
ncbi:MAG TPA: hypothetical protein DD670_07770 [Planctomycetaceae bacterium]|nr:hypothetical protein [Planctomycetaceae bacterium]